MDKEEKQIERYELLRLMYSNVYDELNRSRDWPIKIMAFASGVDVAIYGLLKFNENSHLGLLSKIFLVIIVLIMTIFTRSNILNQHRNYEQYRNIQRGIQKELQIQHLMTAGDPIFPNYWTEFVPDKKSKTKFTAGKWGLGYRFYITFIVALASIALLLIVAQ